MFERETQRVAPASAGAADVGQALSGAGAAEGAAAGSPGPAQAADSPAPTAGSPQSAEAASALLTAVLGAEPGAQMLAQIAGLDPAGLDPDGRLLLVQALERQARWLAAVSARALAAVSGPAWLGDRADEWAGDEVAAALQLSPGTGAIRLMQARQLAGPLAATRAALAAGKISALHARALAEATLAQTDEQAGAVQAAVLPAAAGLTLARFRRAIERATIELDPAGAAQRRDEAVAGRRVVDYPEPNGMVTVAAVLPAEGGALVMTALDAGAARYGADDERGIDARRADVLLGWAAAALDDPTRGRDVPVRPSVAVTVDLATLPGLAERPAELAGYGPIPASVARALAADADWRRFLTDPITGALLDYGRRTYAPPAALAAFVRARDQVCRFPGCSVPARRCDLDHVLPWDAGGVTAAANLAALCRRHHRAKTSGGWRLALHDDANVTWTSPLGRRYQVPPTRHPLRR